MTCKLLSSRKTNMFINYTPFKIIQITKNTRDLKQLTHYVKLTLLPVGLQVQLLVSVFGQVLLHVYSSNQAIHLQ